MDPLLSTADLQAVLSAQPSEYRRALIERCAYTLKTDVRKAKAWDRWCIYTEQHAPLILARILTTQNDPGVRREIAKFVDLTVNPGLDITKQTAVCWRQGARRTIEGASEDQLAAFHELILESRIDTTAPAWNRIASLVGPVIVAPAVRRHRLCWDTLLATFTEVQTDPEDPYGDPTAVAWTIRAQCEQPAKAISVVLDDQAWTTYESTRTILSSGQTETSTAPTRPPVVHGLGYVPISVLRFDAVVDGDWWGSPFLNQRLVDATVAIGVLNAALGFTRKAQNKRLLAIIGDLGGLPDGQTLDAEVPLVADVPREAGAAPSITSIDFDTNPDNFTKHASWIYRNIADAYGGQVEADPTGITSRVVFPIEALTEIRNEQIPQARQFERDLWAAAVDMCRKFGHPLAERLPSREQVLAGFRIDFGKLSRRFADPAAETAWMDWLISKGATDQVEVLRAQGNTTLDDQQLRKVLEKHLENQEWFNDAVTKRNLNMSGSDVQTAAEAFGAMGPKMRDAKPSSDADAGRTPKDNDNERSDRDPPE